MKIAITAKIAVGASLVFSVFAAVAFSTALILKGATPSVQAFMYQSSLLLTSCGADDAHSTSERESAV